MMTHILSNLTELYKNIVGNIEDKLDYDIDMLTIKIFRGKLSAKYDRINSIPNQMKYNN